MVTPTCDLVACRVVQTLEIRLHPTLLEKDQVLSDSGKVQQIADCCTFVMVEHRYSCPKHQQEEQSASHHSRKLKLNAGLAPVWWEIETRSRKMKVAEVEVAAQKKEVEVVVVIDFDLPFQSSLWQV